MHWIAPAILAVSAIIAFCSLVAVGWERKRQLVHNALVSLTNADTARARHVVGKCARRNVQLSIEERENFISSAFQLLWAIGEVSVVRETLEKTRLGVVEAKLLYNHMGVIVDDLNRAILNHGEGVDWNPTVNFTNEVIESLPVEIKSPWDAVIAKKCFTSICIP